MKKRANPLTPGDVVQTHPARGFWGCAVVLSARDSTDKFYPMSHIGITRFISRKKFSWIDIDTTKLDIVRATYDVRVAPNEYYRETEERTCIGIYAIKDVSNLSILGRIDPASIYSSALTFDVGDGTNGRFPMCGLLPDDLGDEAVTAWRRVHDSARLDRESKKDRELYERISEEIRAEDRQKRAARRSSPGT